MSKIETILRFTKQAVMRKVKASFSHKFSFFILEVIGGKIILRIFFSTGKHCLCYNET